MQRRSGTGGYTLIELMVAASIVAMLAAAALYSYRSAQLKNRRAAAETLLASIAQQEQQYFIDNRAYAVVGGTVTIDNVTDSLGLPRISTQPQISNYFTISVTCNPPPPATCSSQPSFYASATPLAGTVQVKDYTLVILSDGTRYAYPSGSSTSQTGIW